MDDSLDSTIEQLLWLINDLESIVNKCKHPKIIKPIEDVAYEQFILAIETKWTEVAKKVHEPVKELSIDQFF